MPLGFFSTLAAWIGIGIVEQKQKTRDERVARENPIYVAYQGNETASKILSDNWWNVKNLLSQYIKEYDEDPPIVQIMKQECGEVQWGYFYALEDCLMYGLLNKRNIPAKNMRTPFRCTFCENRGQECIWSYNRAKPKYDRAKHSHIKVL